ncbi:MAG: RIP metalloprotease RseP [Planctomycetota bacterium]
MLDSALVLAASSPLDRASNILLVVLGIGLVIFVHELGHFLAAKFFRVRVEVFSLGFGPRLWGFTRNGTDYRIAAVPLGGYVKMAGDTPGEESTGAPDELNSKPVGQRFVIFSAGVIMNVVLASILFPIAFAGGVAFPKPAIGSVEPGGPAWKAGLQAGDEILMVNGRRVYGFQDIGVEVAIGEPTGVPLEIRRDGKVMAVTVVPVRDEEEGRYRIGIGPVTTLTVRADGADAKAGPAAKAGITDDDRIVAVNGEALAADEEPWTRLGFLTRATLTIDGKGGRRDVTVVAEMAEGRQDYRIGISPVANIIAGLRGKADDPKLLDWQPGDRIERVNDLPVHTTDEWRQALRRASAEGHVTILVNRGGAAHTLTTGSDAVADLQDGVALKNDLQSTVVRVMPGTPAFDAGLRDGVMVAKVNGTAVATFRDLQAAIANGGGSPITLEVWQDGAARTVTVTPRLTPTDWGFGLDIVNVVRQYDFKGALLAGFDSTYYFLANAYLTLQKILAGQVSSKNLGGIISISVASYTFAQYGILKLLFFLAILSVNLAFINVLPIPLLDGGHLFFLIIEKIKGSPVSQRIMGYSQIIGLVLILALMLYVTYNDIVKLLNWN